MKRISGELARIFIRLITKIVPVYTPTKTKMYFVGKEDIRKMIRIIFNSLEFITYESHGILSVFFE